MKVNDPAIAIANDLNACLAGHDMDDVMRALEFLVAYAIGHVSTDRNEAEMAIAAHAENAIRALRENWEFIVTHGFLPSTTEGYA